MPAALDIDREQVQMLALTYGVREAARMLGIPEGTVCDWSAKGKWVVDRPASVPLPPTMVQAVQAVAPVKALQDGMKGDAVGGRAFGLRLTRRALENIDKVNTDDALCTKEMAEIIHTHIKSASIAGGYSASDAVARVDLRLTAQRSDGATIEAEVVTDQGFTE